jgi:hypothetical protein
VPFTANADGGKAITSYVARSTPGNLTGTNSSSPITVASLSVATNYTFAVAAINANGTSAYSSESNSIRTTLMSLSDNFNRSNGAIGTASDSTGVWSVQRGNFSVDSSMAYSSDTNNSLATVALDSSNITNGQINTYADQGGMGLAFWTTDANSYWAIYPYYTSATTSSSSDQCSGSGYGCCYAINSLPAGTCSRSCTDVNVWGYCAGYSGQYFAGGRTSCSLSTSQRNALNANCNYDWYIEYCTDGSCTVNATNVTVTNYTTNYTSGIRIANQSGVQHENTYTGSGGLNPSRSISISTSGDTISYTGYSGADKGGSVIVSSSYTPSSPTKGNRVGVFKTVSANAQGSYLDNISVTVA